MKVLIVGGGGREHAIAEKLLENPRIDTLYAAPGNGGMAAMATCLPIKATDIQAAVGQILDSHVERIERLHSDCMHR